MIRLGVISLDHPHAVGNHFPALKYIQDRVRVAAIAHPDLKEAKPWLDLFNAKYFSDRAGLLADPEIDAVLITSRNCDHAADAIAAALAGKDVFCDKPIATSVKDARAIVKAVADAKVRFTTTFPVRFNTSVRQVKQAIDAGEFGQIKAIMATNHGCMYETGEPAWVRDLKQNGGGCLIDHTVHVADIIRWLTGTEYATVKSETSRIFRSIDAEDMAIIHGRMNNGTIYQIDASWSRRGRHPMWGDVTFRIVGTRGTATLDLYNNQRIEIYNEGITFKYPNHLCREHGEIFLDYAAGKEQAIPTFGANEIDGLRTIELVFAAYESAGSNQEVKVKQD